MAGLGPGNPGMTPRERRALALAFLYPLKPREPQVPQIDILSAKRAALGRTFAGFPRPEQLGFLPKAHRGHVPPSGLRIRGSPLLPITTGLPESLGYFPGASGGAYNAPLAPMWSLGQIAGRKTHPLNIYAESQIAKMFGPAGKVTEANVAAHILRQQALSETLRFRRVGPTVRQLTGAGFSQRSAELMAESLQILGGSSLQIEREKGLFKFETGGRKFGIERVPGVMPGTPAVVTYQGQLLDQGIKTGGTAPLVFGKKQLSRGAVLINQETGTVTQLTGHEYASLRMNEFIKNNGGLAPGELRRGAIRAYGSAISEQVISGGISPSSLATAKTQQKVLLQRAGSIVDVGQAIREQQALLGGIFTEGGLPKPEVVGEAIESTLADVWRGTEGKGTSLSIAGVKPEAVLKGFLNPYPRSAMIPFGELIEPTAQMWQRFGQGPFTKMSVQEFAAGREGFGRISTPFFTTVLGNEIERESRAAAIKQIKQIRAIRIGLGQPATVKGISPVRTLNLEMGFVVGKITKSGAIKPAGKEFVNQLFSTQGEILASEEVMGLQRSLLPQINLAEGASLSRIAAGELGRRIGTSPIWTPAGKFTIAGGIKQVGGRSLDLLASAEVIEKVGRKSFGGLVEMELGSIISRAEAMAGGKPQLLSKFYKTVGAAVGGTIQSRGGVHQLVLGTEPLAKKLGTGPYIESQPFKTALDALEEIRRATGAAYTGYLKPGELERLMLQKDMTVEELVARGASIAKGPKGEQFLARSLTAVTTLRAQGPETVIAPYRPGQLPFHRKGVKLGRELLAAIESTATPEAAALAKHLRTVGTYSPDVLGAREALRVIYQSTKGGSVILPGAEQARYTAGGFREKFGQPTFLTAQGEPLSPIGGIGRAVPKELERTLWDPRAGFAEGFSIKLDRPVKITGPLTGQPVEISEVPFINRRALLPHLAAEEGILPNRVISAEEKLFRFLQETGGKVEHKLETFERLLLGRSEALVETLAGEHGWAAGALQPRIAGSAAFPVIGVPAETAGIFAREAGKPTALVAEISLGAYAKAIGRKADFKSLLAEGLIQSEEVGGKLRYFTSGMAIRYPIQGRTSVLMPKVFLSTARTQGDKGFRALPEFLKLLKGDSDKDTVEMVFAKSREEHELFRAFGQSAGVVDYAERATVLQGLDEYLRGEGRTLSDVTAKAVGVSEEAFVRQIGTINKFFTTKSITGPLNTYFMDMWTTMLAMKEAGRGGTFGQQAIRHATDLLDIGYQVGSVKKAEAAQIQLFDLLSRVGAPAADEALSVSGLPNELPNKLRKATVDLLLEGIQWTGGVAVKANLSKQAINLKQNTALSRMISEQRVLTELSAMEGSQFAAALAKQPQLVTQLDEMLGPLVHTAAAMNDPERLANRLRSDIWRKLAKASEAVTDKTGERVTQFEKLRWVVQMMEQTQAAAGEDLTLDAIRKADLEMAKVLGFGEEVGQITSYGVAPSPGVLSDDAAAQQAKHLVDPGRKATGPSAWRRAVDWFKDASKPAWQKVGVVAGALLVGGAVMKNTFFPDLIPQPPASELPINPNMGPALDPNIWKQLPSTQDLGGTMPAIGPSYGPRIPNVPLRAEIGPGMQPYALPGNYTGDVSSSPLPPASQIEHGTGPGMHNVSIPARRNVPMSLPQEFSVAPIRPEPPGMEIQVAPYTTVAAQQMMDTFGTMGNVNVAMSPVQSRLERRRQINSNGSLLRPSPEPYGMV